MTRDDMRVLMTYMHMMDVDGSGDVAFRELLLVRGACVACRCCYCCCLALACPPLTRTLKRQGMPHSLKGQGLPPTLNCQGLPPTLE